MPIRPELRHLYGRTWREEVRPKVLARACDRCEVCGARGGSLVLNRRGWTWRVVLTVAHLNHVSGDDRDENLRCWCARCHLVYDSAYHRLTRSLRKDAARPLLDACTKAGGELPRVDVDKYLPGQAPVDRLVNASKRHWALPLGPENMNLLLSSAAELPLLEALL